MRPARRLRLPPLAWRARSCALRARCERREASTAGEESAEGRPSAGAGGGSNGAASVHRGALMYSLPLTPNFTVTAHHFGGDDQSNDYDAVASTPWLGASRPAEAHITGDDTTPRTGSATHGIMIVPSPFHHAAMLPCASSRSKLLEPLAARLVVRGRSVRAQFGVRGQEQ